MNKFNRICKRIIFSYELDNYNLPIFYHIIKNRVSIKVGIIIIPEEYISLNNEYDKKKE